MGEHWTALLRTKLAEVAEHGHGDAHFWDRLMSAVADAIDAAASIDPELEELATKSEYPESVKLARNMLNALEKIVEETR